MSPTVLGVRVDKAGWVHRAQSLLAVVANTPRFGAGLVVAPEARVDDGLLEVRVYEEMTQPALAAHFVAVKTGVVGEEPRVRSMSARKLVIKSAVPLPVVVDSKVVGTTPARFRVVSGGLMVIAGRGDGLLRPAAQTLLSAIKDPSAVLAAQENGVNGSDARLPAASTRSAGAQLAKQSRPLGIALAAGAAIALMPSLSRWLSRRRR
jgi:hypothetical protein